MAYLAARKHTIPNSPWIIVWNEMGEKGIRLKEGQMQLTNEKKIRRASITYLVQFSFACCMPCPSLGILLVLSSPFIIDALPLPLLLAEIE